MAKLTKKQFHRLNEIRATLLRAERYLYDPAVAICRKGGMATTTLHYTRADGSTMYEVEKAIGSDLCALPQAITDLTAILNGQMKEIYG